MVFALRSRRLPWNRFDTDAVEGWSAPQWPSTRVIFASSLSSLATYFYVRGAAAGTSSRDLSGVYCDFEGADIEQGHLQACFNNFGPNNIHTL